MSLVFNYDKDLPKVTPLRATYLQDQVKRIQNIFQPEQRTKEWYDMRENMITASDWGTVLGENHYSDSNSVLKKKCGDDTFITNAAMQWGNKYESVAVLIYEHRNNKKVLEFGCLRHPYISFLGASPDGITEEGVMVEIKCPSSRKITGIPPSYYWCQVQGQLEVCELDRCDFLECSIKEYIDQDAYLMDNYDSNYSLNRFGHEKGIVVEFYRKNEKTFYYDYSPVCLIDDEVDKWKNDILKKHETSNVIFSCFCYWYLEEVSCVPIYRNQEWFQKASIELGIFWDKVLHYRKLGLETLLEDIQQEKNEKKEEKLLMRELKKDESNKKQKKIKDYIILEGGSVTEKPVKKTVTKKSKLEIKLDNNSSSDDEYTDDFVFNTTVSMFSD
jgi:putative phage-type endonuclease